MPVIDLKDVRRAPGALLWILSYVEEHSSEFFPDGNPDGDHAEGAWYRHSKKILALPDPRKG